MSQAPILTADSAKTFDRHSTTSAAILDQAARQSGCACAAYVDWFTYRRWQAQGQQVQKGEHGVKLTTWITFEDKEGKERTRPKGTTVFCRCQVAPVAPKN